MMGTAIFARLVKPPMTLLFTQIGSVGEEKEKKKSVFVVVAFNVNVGLVFVLCSSFI